MFGEIAKLVFNNELSKHIRVVYFKWPTIQFVKIKTAVDLIIKGHLPKPPKCITGIVADVHFVNFTNKWEGEPEELGWGGG